MKKTAKTTKSKVKKTVTAKKTNKKVVAKVKPTNYTHIISILDRSGSMESVKDDAIGGFNSFLKSQKELKEKATMSVVLFDDLYEQLYDGKDVKLDKVQELTKETFVPRGMTALYDAIGKSINNYKKTLEGLKTAEKPDKVLVIIVTDGQENHSKEFTNIHQINNLITEMKGKNWQFMFLCATEDAFKTGASLGISKGNTFQFANTSVGNATLYSKVSSATAMYRSASVQDATFDSLSNNLLIDEEDEDKKA